MNLEVQRMSGKTSRCALSLCVMALMVMGSFVGLLPAPVEAGPGHQVLADTTPPQVWGRTVIYPTGEMYAKDNDLIQIRASIKDNESGIKAGYPVYDLSPWRGLSNQPLFDDGKHLDGYANDGYYASEMITVQSGQRCSYDWIPITVVNGDNLGLNTSITVPIDNAVPKVKNVSLEYPPGQKAVKTGDHFRVTGNATDFCKPSLDVVFDTDDSGSMTTSDPTNLRLQAVCSFAKKFMSYPDRGTGVFFYGYSYYPTSPELFPRDNKVIERHLHDNYNLICNDANTGQSSGNTDGWMSLELSMKEELTYGDPAKNRTIILLTDGQFNDPSPSYNSSNIVIQGANGCIAQKVVIYTVGLGTSVDAALLRWIARQCGGMYFFAQNASVIDPIYQIIGGMLKRLPVPYGVDHVWAQTQSLGSKPYEEMYDDGQHGDGGQNDSYYTGDVLIQTKQTGEFVIPISAWDHAYNSFTNSSLKVKVDNLPPVISSVSVKYASGSKAKDSDAITISASVTDTGVVSGLRDVYLDATSFGGGKWVKMPGSGGTNTSPAIKVYTNGRTGPFPFTVSAYDIAGNLATKDGIVDVDNQDPKVKIYSLVPKQVLTGEYLFAASAFEAVRVSMEITGPSNLAHDMGFDQKSKLWKVLVDTTTLPDGVYNFKVTAYDSYGDTDTAGPIEFKIDNAPPKIAFIPDIKDGEYIEKAQMIATWVTASDGPFTPTVECSIDSMTWDSTQDACGRDLSSSGIWKTDDPIYGGMDGLHTIAFRAIDLAGHVTSVSIDVQVDNHAPILTVIQKPDNLKAVNGVLDFLIDANDAMGIFEVNISHSKGTTIKNDTKTTKLEKGDDGFYHYSIDTRTLGRDGKYKYTIQTIDVPGQLGRSPYIDSANHVVILKDKDPATNYQFIVDNTAPTIKPVLWDSSHKKYINFTNGVDIVVYQGLIYVNATVIDQPGDPACKIVAGVDKVFIRIDHGAWQEMNATNVTNMYQHLWRTGKSDNGPHVIEIKAVDKLGNTGYWTSGEVRPIYVDNPDYTSTPITIIGICSFFILLMGFTLFHWRKYKEIANTSPSGYDTMSQDQMMQYQQQSAAAGEEIQW